jgi:hypothetical protein
MSTDAVKTLAIGAPAKAAPKKLRRLNNKERCRYRTLIGRKLEEMGIKDQCVPVESARKPVTFMNPKTSKFETVLAPKYTLQNLQRRMIKQLEIQPKAVIDAFLKLDQNVFKRAAKE